jgi:thiol-disulfide isomerase/thioredoxin
MDDREIVPFSVQTLAGTTLHSSEWKGRVVVLSFWATWCLPCHAELPEIEEVQNRYRDNRNVLFLALDSGTGGDTPDLARAYLEKSKLSLTGAIDCVDADGNSWGPAATSLGVKSLPALYILDRSGKLRAIHVGYDASEHFVESLSREVNRSTGFCKPGGVSLPSRGCKSPYWQRPDQKGISEAPSQEIRKVLHLKSRELLMLIWNRVKRSWDLCTPC